MPYSCHARLRHGASKKFEKEADLRHKTGDFPCRAREYLWDRKMVAGNIPVRSRSTKKKSGTREFTAKKRFPAGFVFMTRLNSIRKIKYRRKKGFGPGIMFKWFTVLYVDPQKSDDEPTKPSLGNGYRYRERTMQATRYK
jgi:hypothetical protein